MHLCLHAIATVAVVIAKVTYWQCVRSPHSFTRGREANVHSIRMSQQRRESTTFGLLWGFSFYCGCRRRGRAVVVVAVAVMGVIKFPVLLISKGVIQ